MAKPPAADYVKRLWKKYDEPLREVLYRIQEILHRRILGLHFLPEGEYDGIIYEKAWECLVALGGKSRAIIFVGITPSTRQSRTARFIVWAETITPEEPPPDKEDIMARIESRSFPPGTSQGKVWKAFKEIDHPDPIMTFVREFEQSLREMTAGPKEWWPGKARF